MKLTKVLAVIMMAMMFFLVSCGDDDDTTEEKENATVCTDGGNECKDNDNGKTSCIELKCEVPAATEIDDCTATTDCANNTNGKTECISDKCAEPATFGEPCSKSDHSECADAEVCIPAMASQYGMTNAETCSTINCTVVVVDQKPTQSDCVEGYFCVSLEGDYSNFRPALKNATSICVTMAAE